jgi:ABC-type glycerol-3-phosphate transport system substrate-binding protein
MRRILLVAVLFCAAISIFAEPVRETPTSPKLSVLWSGAQALPDGYTITVSDIAEALTRRAYPGTVVEYTLADMSSGADKSMRAAVAAGTPPSVYIDTFVRSASYLRPDFALDLRGYMPDLADYVPGALDGVTRGGAVLGLPLPGDAQSMAVNLDIVRAVGFAPKDWNTWTIAEFLELAEKVRVKYGGTKYVTGLFAGNQSGDYLIRNWAASFGAEFFKGGDYSKTAINTPQGKAMLDFFLLLQTKGYVRPDWITQVDDDYVIDWAKGDLAAAPFFFSWIEPYFKTIEDGGGKRFDYMFVPFPRAPGVSRVGAFYTGTGLVIPKNANDAQNKLAAKYAQSYNSPEAQVQTWAMMGARPNRLSVAAAIGKPAQYSQVTSVVAANGLFDLGGTSPLYAATRTLFPGALQKIGKQPPAQILSEYAEAMDKLLSGK